MFSPRAFFEIAATVIYPPRRVSRDCGVIDYRGFLIQAEKRILGWNSRKNMISSLAGDPLMHIGFVHILLKPERKYSNIQKHTQEL